MPIRKIPGAEYSYYLVVFDERGAERREPDGVLLSDEVQRLVQDPAAAVTDVFLISHGWQGDVPAAIRQYDAWIAAMLSAESDRVRARQLRPGFKPLIVGLHWPSLPWGDERIPANASGAGLLNASPELAAPIEDEIAAYAARIADTPAARDALHTILEAVREDATGELSPEVRLAYQRLFAESGLGSGDASGRPGADQDGFDPDAIVREARDLGVQERQPGGPQLLGFADDVREALLAPLRQLSFWKMKDRARRFGESGGHSLLRRLQGAAPKARFHLMGHSFGCIVASATVAGAPDSAPPPRPVDSLFLVQGALSLWAYAADVPYALGTSGYFHRIMKQGLVRGPIVTTLSERDTAVGRFYPLGARLRKQVLLADTPFPKYGGIGSFGIQGAPVEALQMGVSTHAYAFQPGRIYNLESSHVIKHGGGASGAHSDIAHPEVAHAFWSAVLAGGGGPQLQQQQHQQQQSAPPPPSPAPAASRGARSAPGRGPRPGLLDAEEEMAPPPPAASIEPPAPAPSAPPFSMRDPGAGSGASPPKPAPTPERADPPQPGRRWFNAELEDHAPDAALKVHDWYTLALDVDVAQRASALATAALDEQALFDKDVDDVTLTVQLDSEDFEVNEHTRPLRLSRTGRSHGKARFDISPRHNGASRLRLTIHKEGNFIQQLSLTFDVGAPQPTRVEASAKGRPATASAVVKARDVGLSVQPAPGGGYDCIMWGAVAKRARLTIRDAHLASAIEAARREIMKVVMHQGADGEYVFQTAIDIPQADTQFALQTLARAGARLFQQLFFGPAAGADSKTVGECLRELAKDPGTRLKLQIIAESTPAPWGLLYVGDAGAGAKLDWNLFLGMHHILERIPLQNTPTMPDSEIPSEPQLAVSLNLNSHIDVQMASDFVAKQQTFWANACKARPRIALTPRTLRAEVVQALADPQSNDQILYFYCHADSAALDGPGGPDASRIVLSDASITLGDLSLDAPSSTPLAGNPLVFINACESAELSPLFYDGFVPYFMAKGARGVVGTECKTPALFASVWAERFFDRFLDGEPLGEAFLALRREFLEQHGNPLGLLYAVHCDGDTKIAPALKAVTSISARRELQPALDS